MSTDYRPRGGGESTGGRGGRRRRGGRGRGHTHGSSTHTHGEARAHTNGTPKKKEGFFSKLLGIFKGKKKQPESKPVRSESPVRPEYKERDREPRAERPRREERPARVEPTPQEITAPKLYVGNLAYEAAEGDLHDLFSKVGFVKSVEVATDRRTSRSKGFGFVEMDSIETAKAAAEKLNRTDFMGRQIVVSGAKLDKRPSREDSADGAESSSTESSDTPTQSETGSGESTI